MSAERGMPLEVLVLEDEEANLVLLRAVLARAADPRLRSAHVAEARTVAAARHALAHSEPDLVVLDVRLPDGSGLDVARELSTRSGERPLVIIMSASVLAGDRDAARSAGCDAFLAKPFRPVELVETLADLLTIRAAQRSAVPT